MGDKSFVFDQIFDHETRQETVYDSTVKHLVEGSLQGFNGTIFAYGQTGSGNPLLPDSSLTSSSY
jgi:hypothetical protein